MPRDAPFRSQKLKKTQKKAVATRMAKKTASLAIFSKAIEVVNEMEKKYFEVKSNKPLILFDLDGTLIGYRTFGQKESIVARPHLHALMKAIKPYYDIGIYSAADPEYVSTAYYQYLSRYAIMCFDSGYLVSGKKSLAGFTRSKKEVIFIEDTHNTTDLVSKNYVHVISRWTGAKSDDVLLKLKDTLLKLKDATRWVIPTGLPPPLLEHRED